MPFSLSINRSKHSIVAAYVLLAVVLGMFVTPASAGGGPENVLLVVNTDSFSSVAIANEFIRVRHIPACNVLNLALGDRGSEMDISVNDFRTRILGPVLAAIKDRGLQSQIDYVVYSSDIPYRVSFESDAEGTKLPQPISANASITSLTFFHELVMAKDIKYLALDANRYARQPFPDAKSATLLMAIQRTQDFMNKKDFVRAEEACREVVKARPNDMRILFNHACLLGAIGKDDEAMAQLTKAVDNGFNDAAQATKATFLKAIRERQEFARLLERMKTAKPPPAQMPMDISLSCATQGFRSSYAWNSRLQIDDAGDGQRYLLSAMLGWTSGRGNSINDVLACLRRSAKADGSRPKGTIYYMLDTAEIRSTTRMNLFPSAVAGLKQEGIAAEILKGQLPVKKDDVAGLMAGLAAFNWRSSGSTMLPGAIAEHLTSFSGIFAEDANQTPCTEWIRAGASGTCGPVFEPFALQAKFPLPFLQLHYARGCSMAEAMYQSITGPYQLLILGDPLCQPWAIIPQVSVDAPSKPVKGTLSLKPTVKPANNIEILQWDLFVDGKLASSTGPAKPIELDTTKLADGYHELRVVAVSTGAVQAQGRSIVGIEVDNAGKGGKCTVRGTPNVKWGTVIVMEASVPGAGQIVLTCNGREVGRITGAKGQAKVDTRLLGLGEVKVLATGMTDSAQAIACRPVDLNVSMGPPLKGATLPASEPTPGLLLQTAAGKGRVVMGNINDKYVIDSNWLIKAGVETKQVFKLDTYYKVDQADLYQFQVQFNGVLQIQVDGQNLVAQSVGKTWRHLPVNLGAGWHHIVIRGAPSGNAAMDIRFSNNGSYRINGKRFACYPSLAGR